MSEPPVRLPHRGGEVLLAHWSQAAQGRPATDSPDLVLALRQPLEPLLRHRLVRLLGASESLRGTDRVSDAHLLRMVHTALNARRLVLLERPQSAKPARIEQAPNLEPPLDERPQTARTQPAHPRVTVHLQRLYHDDEPLQRAPFELVTADGQVVEGRLDNAGTATIPDLPKGPMRVRFGPDARPYEVKDQRKNPEFVETFSPALAEALVARYVR